MSSNCAVVKCFQMIPSLHAASAVKSIPYRAPLVSSKENKKLYICTIWKDVDLDTILLPARLKEIAVAQLDSLGPSEQMAVKCAAVIGHTFTPELLLYLLPEWTNKKMEETLLSLINSHVFECFGKEARATQAVGSRHLHTHLDPWTMQTLGPEESEDAAERTDAPLGQELAIETPMASCEDNLQCRAKSAMNKQVLPDDHLRVEQEFLDRVDKMIKCHKHGEEEATNLAPCECGERVE
ncbi:adenylate cyclase type 10-like [Chrysemys picta bellii]|uniref:adenylate cyclase type 10-like n=1 Tax=Chrysemys picta bellii TaxID=8478 RepID=UPI0032B2BC45